MITRNVKRYGNNHTVCVGLRFGPGLGYNNHIPQQTGRCKKPRIFSDLRNLKMAKTATVNYTPEQTAEMLAAYNAAPTTETVEMLAEKLGKTTRSIVAKLSRENVYKKKEYTTKNGEKVEKKDTTADAIGAILKLKENDIESLTKANKTALKAIFEALANSKPIEG